MEAVAETQAARTTTMARKPTAPSQDEVDSVWEKGTPIKGKNPDIYRRDAFGNEIYKPSYGKSGEKSWEIDHVKPLAKGGSENLRNKQPLQTDANGEKGDQYPFNPSSSKRRGK
jgi:5-methylcytosine-specific restriction endonuclease McrA